MLEDNLRLTGVRLQMSQIHYFPNYSQQENVVTNNTRLLLLRLYRYNRYKFEKLMEALALKRMCRCQVLVLQFGI